MLCLHNCPFCDASEALLNALDWGGGGRRVRKYAVNNAESYIEQAGPAALYRNT